ncbi:hypothetical protein H5410_058915 [Solanum commersonii]|uniref:Uncharacterized protein n=1 Tax=Solanum commersonii TaxID=4109 RepID=A0A9J5W0Y2_SOLCO|nr:hypothetical protein H5410_058915 [Solanum commersonii]
MDARYDLVNVASWSKGFNGPIFKFKQTQSRKNQILLTFVCYCPQIFGDRIPKFYMPRFFIDVRYDFINGVSWSQGKNRPIFKFKRTAKQETLEFFLPKFLVDVHYDIINGASWSQGEIGPICKFKRAQSKKN